MELFLLRHAEWERLYNCTGQDVDDAVPSAQRRTSFVPEAMATIVLCATYYALYAPCMVSIWRHCRQGTSSCYTLLFYIGIMDTGILWIIGFLHGWLSLQGAVFCTYPLAIYWADLAIRLFFMAESSADLVLAFNRCVDILAPELGAKLFAGWRIRVWLAACTGYALYWMIFLKPVLFSSVHFAWYFNPFIGYREDSQGQFSPPPAYAAHDTTIAVGSPLIYLLFVLGIRLMSNADGSSGLLSNITRAQKMIFLQVFLISIINTVTCALYIVIQHVDARQWMITLAQFGWLHIHGIPPVIYLTLNKTIRNDCRLLVCKLCCPKRVARVNGITVLAGAHQQRRQNATTAVSTHQPAANQLQTQTDRPQLSGFASTQRP